MGSCVTKLQLISGAHLLFGFPSRHCFKVLPRKILQSDEHQPHSTNLSSLSALFRLRMRRERTRTFLLSEIDAPQSRLKLEVSLLTAEGRVRETRG